MNNENSVNEDKPSFRLQLQIPLVLAIIVMSILVIYSMVYTQEDTLHKSKEPITEQFTRYFDKKVENEAAVISEFIAFIQDKAEVARLLEAGDKRSLYDAIEETYKSLNAKVELTHMYFIKPDGRVLLRAHDYKRDLDIIDRATFLKAKESQSLYYGLEFGLKKNYTLRVVAPWMVDGRLIGYLELGKEIDKIINEYAVLLDTHVYLAVKKAFYESAPKFVKERLKKSVATDEYYIVYQTFDVPDQIGSILSRSIFRGDITFQERSYFTTKKALSDISGQQLGYFVFLNDVTFEHDVIFGSVRTFAIILVIVEILLFILGFILIRRKEQEINGLTSRLDEQKDELMHFNVKLQKIFDVQKNIIVITDGKTLEQANRALYDFLGFKDLDDFLSYYKCICDRFVENDNFFHLGKVPEGKNWVETIHALSGEKRIVAMVDDELTTHVFSVSVNEFEESRYVIAFTDISNTMLEQVKLMRKVTHDKLTGALNREFFEKNIAQIIKEVRPDRLGVVLADIDHFKYVNDTFGHNRGDEVLKQFVRTIQDSIRSEDYFVRWGGEEFILLMKVNSAVSLKKAIENIRISIENDRFEEVKSITASFGGTLYQEGEKIDDTIGRADQALYQAKENGRNQVAIV